LIRWNRLDCPVVELTAPTLHFLQPSAFHAWVGWTVKFLEQSAKQALLIAASE
jgi:hypothetical protein